MKVIVVASQKLFFKDVQPAKRQPAATLVLIHGAGGSHLSWRRQFGELSDQFRIIAVDLPGHGQSEGAGEATIDAYSGYVVELIKSLGLRDVILGGHSMGGAIALDIALREPARIAGLLLAGTGAKLRVLPAIFSVIREDFELAIQGMAGFMFGPVASSELIEEEKELLAKSSADVMLRDFTACDSFDIMEKVGSIHLPTLIVCGKEDRLTPPKYSELLHENIPGSELILLNECGHLSMLEQSDKFNKCLTSFIMKL
jgi:pimeloyl-ACP methyl ester carboxylesterase